jgi:hypothetical protein
MAGLIIEQLGRTGGQSVFHRVTSLPLRIGRAPDNDIILADPYVSPRHLIIEESDNGWIAADCGSDNGVFTGKGARITAPIELQSGDFVQIGRTVLRFLSPAHEVPPALPFKQRRGGMARFLIPALSILSLLLAFAMITADRFFDTVTETKLLSILAGALPFLFFPLLWAGLWALAGFIVKRRGDFSMQLIVASCALILFFLLATLAEWADYRTSSIQISELMRYGGMGLLSMLLLIANLRLATGIADFRRAIIALSIGGGIIAVIAVSNHAQKEGYDITPEYSSTLKPPSLLPLKAVTMERFFRDADALFKEDKQKSRESRAGAGVTADSARSRRQ